MSEPTQQESTATGRPANKRPDRGREMWPKNRPSRMSLGERGSLTYDPKLLSDLKSQGLTPRLVNDDPGRIDTAIRRGWKFVQDDGAIGDEKAADPSRIGGNAVKHVGSGKAGYLMAIPTEWYEEDQRKKQDSIDETEKAMRAPKKKLSEDSEGKAYGPGLTNE